MQQYDTYKDSGVYFLPDLPANWEIRKAKYLFKEENRPVKPDDEIVTCFRDGQVTLRKNRRVEGFTNSLKEIGYQGVRKGDLVIHNMDAFAGSIGISDSDGKATPVYSCCTPLSSEVNQFYYCYLLRFLARNGFILSLAKGIRERSTDFRFNDFKELYLPLPSREEQDAIVKHIDTATAKIDAAIAQQQKMIDLLNERKQIIINRAVTKGLNPNAKMKDSGVEWIGEVPEGWDTCALKKKAKVILGKMLSNNPTNKYKYICAKDVHYGEIDTSDLKEMSFTHEERQLYEVKKGDMLIVEGGAGAGGCAIVKEDLKNIYIQNSIMIVRGAENLLNDYLCFFMQSINQKGYIAIVR
jgi:type I restriction enzyme S subunit